MWKNPSTFIVLSNVKKIEISLDKKRKITYQFYNLVSIWVWKEKGSYCTYFWYALQYYIVHPFYDIHYSSKWKQFINCMFVCSMCGFLRTRHIFCSFWLFPSFLLLFYFQSERNSEIRIRPHLTKKVVFL